MSDPVLATVPLGFAWQTIDPFLFCVHHDDAYPAGDERLGPAATLAGRNLGQDFEPRDGWRMYHGRVVPGFPSHPHRGFETITLVRRGYIDHSDSLGAAARFGQGDVQWMTAGAGVVHSEMFPLLRRDAGNPVELFQVWMNLPAADKMVPPHFKMLWADRLPLVQERDAAGRYTTIGLVAGRLGDAAPPSPPPHSWASREQSDVAIWTVRMDPGATWTLPPARPGTQRVLYAFAGEEVEVAGRTVRARTGLQLRGDAAVPLRAGPSEVELLLLQGRPIGERVVQHGPFVMNSEAEIRQAFTDYQRTRFGGWPWDRDDPVHDRAQGRFARYPDGRVETP